MGNSANSTIDILTQLACGFQSKSYGRCAPTTPWPPTSKNLIKPNIRHDTGMGRPAPPSPPAVVPAVLVAADD